ncbi:uncharacterized protein LOC111115891 [Crassostrea virginica]
MATMLKENSTFMSLLATSGLWLTAMFTPGWTIIPVSIGNTSRTFDFQISLIYYRVCYGKNCVSGLNKNMIETSEITEAWTELQFEGFAALALCLVCCGFVKRADRWSCDIKSKALYVIVLSAIAVLAEITLILRFNTHMKPLLLKYVTMEGKFAVGSSYSEHNLVELKNSYSVVIAGIGCLTGAFGWILSIVYYSSLKRITQTDDV